MNPLTIADGLLGLVRECGLLLGLLLPIAFVSGVAIGRAWPR